MRPGSNCTDAVHTDAGRAGLASHRGGMASAHGDTGARCPITRILVYMKTPRGAAIYTSTAGQKSVGGLSAVSHVISAGSTDEQLAVRSTRPPIHGGSWDWQHARFHAE
jgi:hypothetical protein